MNTKNLISRLKDNLSQIWAITEKNVRLRLRNKTGLILSLISPIIGFILPVIIFGQLFLYSINFGPWNQTNFIIYILLAYEILFIYGVMNRFPGELTMEKYWKTLPSLIIAPFNRINLLLGIFCTHFIVIGVPFTFFIVLCWIFYPISIFTLFWVLGVLLLIAIFFSGIGLVLGILAISREDFLSIIQTGVSLIFQFSCISLPYDFFPSFFQNIVDLNPLYYIFDLPRVIWIENDILYSFTAHPIHWFILISCTILAPIMGLLIFNYIYDKYGIQGY